MCMVYYVVLDLLLSEYVIFTDGTILTFSNKELADIWINNVEIIEDYNLDVLGRYIPERLEIDSVNISRFHKPDVGFITVRGISTVNEFDEIINVKLVKEV